MGNTKFHWLAADGAGAFDHVAVSGADEVLISVGYYRIQMSMDVAEEVCTVLDGYIRDREMLRDEYWKEADSVMSEKERMEYLIKQEQKDVV